MPLLYALGVRGYSFLVRVASLWNPKAKKWITGRKDSWIRLQNFKLSDESTYWFHCASLGEFEQGRPLMEKLKAQDPNCRIVITFFSPSGYDIRKDYALADLVIYLPQETKRNVGLFLDHVQPDSAFFIKYEFWATYIFEAKKRGVKIYSVAAVFRKEQSFFKFYGGYMRSVLQAFDQIFVQDEKSLELLSSIQINGTLAGDTRYDRVMENAKKVQPYPEIQGFIGHHKVLVVGSSWEADEVILADLIHQESFDWKVIIAPHEIDANRIESIEKRFNKPSVRYSDLKNVASNTASVLIIDNIGMLMNVYQYADLAYVGGAFGKGLHNILEPACFGVPVIFGANYSKFNEAFDFISHEIGYSVSNGEELKQTFQQLSKTDINAKVLSFMRERQGATALILDTIELS